MTPMEFVTTPEYREVYVAWLKRGDTQAILDAVFSSLGPQGLPSGDRTGEKALYYAGLVDAHRAIRQLLTNMTSLADTQALTDAVSALQSTYGSAEILKQQGLSNKGDK